MALFNYSKSPDVVKKSGGGFLPGHMSAVSPVDVKVAAVAGGALEDGQVVKMSLSNGIVTVSALASGNAATDVYGVIIHDVHGERSLGEGIIHTYVAGDHVTVLRQGYVAVPLQDVKTNVTAGGTVYVRVTASGSNAGLPIGGIETAADSAKCVAISAKFTGEVGCPLTGTQNGTTASAVTQTTAIIKLTLGL